MKTVGNHIHAAVLRAVTAEIEAAPGLCAGDRQKPMMIVEDVRSTDWASATFVGARHEIDIRIEGDAALLDAALQRLAANIGEREIPIAGQIVAEIGVNIVNQDKRNLNLSAHRFTVNVLTIVD